MLYSILYYCCSAMLFVGLVVMIMYFLAILDIVLLDDAKQQSLKEILTEADDIDCEY